jgi:hypothetical protein
VNKASSLALLAGALVAAAAFAPVSWSPEPAPLPQLVSDVIAPVVVEARLGKRAEAGEPAKDAQPALPEPTTILLPSRSKEQVKASPKPYEPLGLVRDLQRELKRIGCYPHEIDGAWTLATRRAMKDFTDRVNAALPVERPDPAQLVLLQRHPEIVCRENCRLGESFADTRCFASSPLASEKKLATTTPGLQLIWTKSYVTPTAPEPDPAEAAPLAEAAPRVDPAPPRPRRHTSRPSGVGSLLFGIFSW